MFEQINSLNITDKASVKFGKKVTIFAEKFKLCLKKGEYYAEKLHERNLADWFADYYTKYFAGVL